MLLARAAGLLIALPLAACDIAYPEVAVVNQTAARVLLKNLSFSGCQWDTVLGLGDSTSPGRCLPGEDRVHLEKLDLDAQEGTTKPLWFRYQTVSVKRASYGSFERFEITLDDLEQDFTVPGPYGH